MVSSLALLLADSREKNIMKLVWYPRAIECLYETLCAKGYMKKIKHGEVLTYMMATMFGTHNFLFENDNPPKSFLNFASSYACATTDELTGLHA